MIDPPGNSKGARLGREERRAIARGLREWYQHVVDEGIPEQLQQKLAKLLSKELPGSPDQAARSVGMHGQPDRTEEPGGDEPPTGPDKS